MRATAAEAEYMELRGAEKDADCEKVAVKGGISSGLGCCDYFKPESEDVQEFRCGECRFRRDDMNLQGDADADDFNEPSTSDTTSTPAFPTYQRATKIQGSTIHSPFLNSMSQRKVKVRSQALATAISRSKRARPSSYKFGG